MFTITLHHDARAVVVIPNGRLDALNHPVFEKELKPMFAADKFLVIDFSNCPYLSSSGIRLLISASKQLNARGGALMLCSLSPEVFQVIEMTGLLSVFRVFKDQ